MQRNGIFLKIYLWFWVTTALILIAQVGLDRLTLKRLPGPFHMEISLRPVLQLHSYTILQRHQRRDTAGVLEAREDLKKATGLDAFVIDGAGSEITARPVPDDVRQLAAAARSSGRPETAMVREGPLLALPWRAANGAGFVTVARMPRPSAPPPPPPRSLFVDISRLLVVLLVSAGVCYGLARYISRPVMKLREVTQRFSHGDLTARIGRDVLGRKDELGGLGDDFNQMAHRTESLVVHQRQLLGDISHELRSPLTRLTLALEIARKKSWDEAGPALARIETEAGLMEEMISQVLMLTRLETDTVGIPMAPVEIAGLVEEIASNADFEARGRGCVVHVTSTGTEVVRGNEDLLRRAVENVVRNAVRYTASGTSVDISLSRREDNSGPQAEVVVRDHGPGVPEEELVHMFRPFYRISPARDRVSGGTGLGLAITARSVAFHGGSVAARNGAGGGLIVSIRLPLSTDPSFGSSVSSHLS